MSNSKITLEFIDAPQVGDTISFKATKLTAPFTEIIFSETYQAEPRELPGQMNTLNTNTDLNAVSSWHYQFLNADYNSDNLFNIQSSTVNVFIVIEAIEFGWSFSDFQGASRVEAIIENASCNNFVVQPGVNIDESTYGSQNTVFNLNLETLDYIKTVKNNGLIISNNLNNNVFNQNLNRGENINIEMFSMDGFCNAFYPSATENLFIPKMLEEYFQVQTFVINNTLVAKVFFTGPQSVGYDIQFKYNLNNSGYVESNVFELQGEGENTVEIKDGIGGVVSITFEAKFNGIRSDYFNIPNGLAVGFVKQVEKDCSNENYLNSFAICSKNLLSYADNQVFSNCDKISIQVKSNYTNNSLTLRCDDETTQDYQLVKKSNNLNIFESLRGLITKGSESTSYLHFQTGDTFNSVGNVIGFHNYLGSLPDFCKPGNLVEVVTSVDTNYAAILDVFFNEDLNSFVAEININFDNIETNDFVQELSDTTYSAKITSVYDSVNYEVYEAVIDLSDLECDLFDIVLKASNSEDDEIVFITENLELIDDTSDTVYLMYYNNYDGNLIYSYGLRNTLRLRCLNQYIDVENDNSINVNDEIASVLYSDVHDGDKFEFDDVIRSLALTTIIAVSSDNVFINQVGYVKNGNVNVENIENTNMNKVNVSMVKSGKAFTGYSSSTEQSSSGGSSSDFTADSLTISADSNTATADQN